MRVGAAVRVVLLVGGEAMSDSCEKSIDVIGPLFVQACALLDNVQLHDTPEWKRGLANLKADVRNARNKAKESDEHTARAGGVPA